MSSQRTRLLFPHPRTYFVDIKPIRMIESAVYSFPAWGFMFCTVYTLVKDVCISYFAWESNFCLKILKKINICSWSYNDNSSTDAFGSHFNKICVFMLKISYECIREFLLLSGKSDICNTKVRPYVGKVQVLSEKFIFSETSYFYRKNTLCVSEKSFLNNEFFC
jgi:hypothetical protein